MQFYGGSPPFSIQEPEITMPECATVAHELEWVVFPAFDPRNCLAVASP
jgi:hypothetical protein